MGGVGDLIGSIGDSISSVFQDAFAAVGDAVRSAFGTFESVVPFPLSLIVLAILLGAIGWVLVRR